MIELWKQFPLGFRILWAVSALLGLTVTGLIVVLLFKLIMKL